MFLLGLMFFVYIFMFMLMFQCLLFVFVFFVFCSCFLCLCFSSPRVKVLLLYCASSSFLLILLHPPPAAASCIRRIHSLCRSTWGPALRPRARQTGIRLPKLGGPKSCLSVTLVGGADSPRFLGRPCCCCNQPC